MNQFDKNIIVTFKENDQSSIKSALIKYQELLKSGKAFVQGFTGLFNVEFKIEADLGTRRLQTWDVKDTTALGKALRMAPEGNWKTQTIQNNDEIYISEAVFFAIALEHEALKYDVVETAKAIVSTMRHYNNIGRVWVDDMQLFGVEALYLLALKHPEFSYLLGSFFILHWDLEHAVDYEYYLSSLVEQYGWTRDLMKAYIWCDNPHFRYCMIYNQRRHSENNLSSQPLGDFLQKNPTEYSWFKQAIIERFKAEPVLLHSRHEDVEERNAIIQFYITLYHADVAIFDSIKSLEMNNILQCHFIHDTLENEAFDLQKTVTDALQGPLIKYREGIQQSSESQSENTKACAGSFK